MNDAFAAKEPVLVPCRDKYSFFFDLIQEWDGCAPLHRVCSLMRKMGVSCYTTETLELNAELKEEQAAAAVRVQGSATISAYRYTFFRSLPTSSKWRDLDTSTVLGYAVLADLRLKGGQHRKFVLESVVRVPSLWIEQNGTVKPHVLNNTYLHCSRDFDGVIGFQKEHLKYTVHGTFFCQQNNLTHVCAHAAIRMAMGSSSKYNGPKITNKRINDALGLTHRNDKTVGIAPGQAGTGNGLTIPQIQEAVKAFGWKTHSFCFQTYPGVEYDEFIYPLIESGYPAILGIQNATVGHVVTVLGHTLNTDRWSPEARQGYASFHVAPYVSTCAWVDHFIVSDDNYGMCVALPTDSVRNFVLPKYNPIMHACDGLGLLPDDVEIPGDMAERAAGELVGRLLSNSKADGKHRWFDHLIKEATAEKSTRFVCRTLLKEKAQYLEGMAQAVDSHGQKLTAAERQLLEKILPERFWVTEITVAQLYAANKRKLGDVINSVEGQPNAGGTPPMPDVLFAWLPGHAWDKTKAFNWSFVGHVSLIRGAAQGGGMLEW